MGFLFEARILYISEKYAKASKKSPEKGMV